MPNIINFSDLKVLTFSIHMNITYEYYMLSPDMTN